MGSEIVRGISPEAGWNQTDTLNARLKYLAFLLLLGSHSTFEQQDDLRMLITALVEAYYQIVILSGLQLMNSQVLIEAGFIEECHFIDEGNWGPTK